MYAFNNENGVVQTAVFYPDDVLAGDRFGESLSVSNDLIAIGADAHQNTGAVYTYKKQNGNWEFLQKIMPADGNPDDYFGSAVKISGEYLFISATGDEIDGDPANTNSGSVWVYKWNGNYAVVGAPKEGTGKAYTIDASLLSSRSFSNNDVSLYPNPTSDIVKSPGILTLQLLKSTQLPENYCIRTPQTLGKFHLRNLHRAFILSGCG